MIYIVTFYSHFGAIQYKNFCDKLNIKAEMSPVPRNLSSSCGTCVKYKHHAPILDESLDEIDSIFLISDADATLVYRA